LFHRTTVIPCSELSDGPVDIWFAPEQAGAIVEEVEVVSVITFLLDYLELNVLVIDFFFP